jgi:hypothetical protein
MPRRLAAVAPSTTAGTLIVAGSRTAVAVASVVVAAVAGVVGPRMVHAKAPAATMVVTAAPAISARLTASRPPPG